MATGSITTLGLGSGLELQNILDQLKDADRASISNKESQRTSLQTKIDAYNSVNAKLLNIKSDALSLSLESDFLKTSVTTSDEEIATITANDGIAATTFDLELTQKARFNSWQSAGVESASSVIYPAPESGIATPTESVTTASQTYDILYGSAGEQSTISVTVASGQSLEQIAQAINTAESNTDGDGGTLVTATVAANNGEYYIRLSATGGGDSVEEQVELSGFDYIKTDTIIGIARADSADAMYVSLSPGTTYSDVVTRINNGTGNPGVTAALIDTGDGSNPYKLTLTSNATGEDHRISIQNLSLTEVNGAGGDSLNAHFTVNGVSYQRQSNDAIKDVVSGVTINLKKAGQTSVGVQQDSEAVKENVLSLVENFNELITLIQGDAGDEETQEDADDNPLDGDYTISGLSSRLRNLFTTSVDIATAYKSLGDIGLEVNRDGTLTLNEETLDQALASDYDAVTNLFIGNEDADVTGLGDLLNDAITDMVSATGAVTTEIDEAETRMARLDQDIETATEQLDKRYETLTQSFVRLDSYIRQLNAESAYLSSMIESFNKTNEK